jgi:hypothetical protein
VASRPVSQFATSNIFRIYWNEQGAPFPGLSCRAQCGVTTSGVSRRLVDMHIASLRKKLEKQPHRQSLS